MTAISAGKIYGLSGNRGQLHRLRQQPVRHAGDRLPAAAGEVHLTRDGRLLSVQNFAMGNHEVDTRGLPYGITTWKWR